MWMALGDFNEILGNHEKSDERTRPESTFIDFRMMMRQCDFTDLPSVGNRFLWVGKRGTDVIQCCLDRVMANTHWFSEFPVSETLFLELGESDHRPLITYVSAQREKPRRSFCYDSRMCDKDGFQAAVTRGWNETGQATLLQIPLSQRISRCRHQISVWKRSNRTNAEERIRLLRGRLDTAIFFASITQEETNMIKEDLNQAYLEEKIFWKQKSIIMWLRAGDRNTSYFHAVSRGKRIKSTLSSIQDDNGVIHRGHSSIAK